MTVAAKTLIASKYAANSDNTEYTAGVSTTTIIDKVTATNTDGSARTITVNIVPSGQSVGASNIITDALSINANTAVELTELKNHILSPGDFISLKADAASKVVIRGSGREITP